MGDVGGELAARLFGEEAVGDVGNEHHRAADAPLVLDGAGHAAVVAAAHLHLLLGVFAAQGGFHGLGKLEIAVERQQILALADGAGQAQQLFRRAVDGQYLAARVEQHQRLGHVAGDGGELVALRGERGHRLVDALVLSSMRLSSGESSS